MSTNSTYSFTSQLGIGLLEISALTAVIGSSTAESLALGNRGVAGLAWAVLSTFGLISVVKACIGAVTPAALRESLGVRTQLGDAAVGLGFSYGGFLRRLELRTRADLGDAVGIVCLRQKVRVRLQV